MRYVILINVNLFKQTIADCVQQKDKGREMKVARVCYVRLSIACKMLN